MLIIARWGKTCYNSVIIFIFQVTLLRWLSFLLGSQTVILLLDLSLSSDTSIFFYNGFPSIGKFWSCRLSFHWLSIKFKTGCPVSLHSLWLFLCWLGWSCDHLRDVPWKDIFKLDASAAASEFCEFSLELMYISLIENNRSSLTHLHHFQVLVLLP